MASVSLLRRARVHAPWSAAAWRDTVFTASGVPLQLAAWTMVGLPWTLWEPDAPPAVLLASVVPVAAVAVLVFPLATAQRERCWAMLGLRVAAPRERTLAAMGRPLRYHLLAGPALACGGLLVILAWAGGLGLSAIMAYGWTLPSADPFLYGLLTLAGLVLLAAAPWLAAAVRRLDARAVAALLGPDRAEELERRVEDLAEKRAGVVDAADIERRRIERDLHDGAQQRLVSLAMNLGLARETLTGVPDPAMRVIVEAHEEAKEALADMRALIRGLHPAVLEDRGLDAALSGVAARVPLPVRLRVDVPVRASSTVEAVAYFVVSEALTNVVKHARASAVEIDVERRGDVLRVRVADDGVGGADPAGGSGLVGLGRRVGSVDGTFRIVSPAGGPTTVTVELPCAL
ncbi:sensor histidine kinase [Spirillospora sp. NPDC029432]|uniref:sensor histidine kinase n=1 Tax=Spirillospora sp. NPDC029432 TaxID=3154599 RepID=UPI003455EF79